jgi:Domain of unknown function (DUF4430)
VTLVRILAAALALGATAVAGCGLGPGESTGDVDLTVSRDYGSKVLLQKQDSIHESDTVFRVLDRNADVSTRYGGGFVQSIDGLSGTQGAGSSDDWFFYVNGIESPIGATQYDLSAGDRIWWDYRDWAAAMRVPAAVGSWPEPFVHGFQGHRWTTTVNCWAPRAECQHVETKLHSAGVTNTPPAVIERDESGDIGQVVTQTAGIRVMVGPWNRVRTHPVAQLLAQGPSESGVFARFVGTKKSLLELLNQQGQPAGSVGKGGGLIAALREGDGPPTWVVTGNDEMGVAAAVNLLGPALRNHYAVATQPGAGPIGVPVQ